jgi:acryloyl-coenzyme A reductase
MRAIVIRENGGADRLEAVEMADPSPSTGQVLLRVGGCGVCYRDIVDRRGGYPFMRKPVVTGHEIAGTIEAVGAGAGDFAVGDRVALVHRAPCGECAPCKAGDEVLCLASPVMYGVTVDGGYAEKCVAYASSLARVPEGVPLEKAAFLHCTAAVALRALRRHANLHAGQSVLITGASGGVGVHAIQIAKILGARVVALTTSPEKAERLGELGADDVVIARDGNFHKEVLAKTGGVNVALELTGAATFNGALRSLAAGGRLVVVGNVTGERLEANPGYLIIRELSATGSLGATRGELSEVLAWAAAGKLRPIVSQTRPLDEARAAQELLEHKGGFGRQVLVP